VVSRSHNAPVGTMRVRSAWPTGRRRRAAGRESACISSSEPPGVGRVTGGEVELERIPPGAPVTTVGPPIRETLSMLVGMLAVMPNERPAETGTADRFGLRFTSIDEFLRSALTPQAATGSASA
jgi:hypothetical protein